jgi:hypothetical protein
VNIKEEAVIGISRAILTIADVLCFVLGPSLYNRLKSAAKSLCWKILVDDILLWCIYTLISPWPRPSIELVGDFRTMLNNV